MDGISIIISPAERRVWRANRCYLETVTETTSQLVVAREEEVDPTSNSSEIRLVPIARVPRWLYLQGRIELDEQGIAPAYTNPDWGWSFPEQKAEPEPKEALSPSEFSAQRPPRAPRQEQKETS